MVESGEEDLRKIECKAKVVDSLSQTVVLMVMLLSTLYSS